MSDASVLLTAEGNPIPKDGHATFATQKSDFYKERFNSESRSRSSFNSGHTIYKKSRNTILAEPTPRDRTYTREPVGYAWTGKPFIPSKSQNVTSPNNPNRVFAEAQGVDLELERLKDKKKMIEMKVNELDRLLEFKEQE
mmetsp:Transcript_18012/g.33481  ORF Transcript_18012/g.33481 Transcript_18012/m.33481 type:complete len:140 (+) Transcript_18012:37-456(+)